jgi:hypothetical protein
MAAFTTVINGGFIPHALHGGNGVLLFAVVGSKFEGTGFEKEHIGHIHVALIAGFNDGAGLPYLCGGVEAGLVLEIGRFTGVAPRLCNESRFDGFG